jgi:hypothetical protein
LHFPFLHPNICRVKAMDKFNAVLRPGPLSRRRILAAIAVAVVADALQIMLLPFAWTFVQSAVDIVAMVLTVGLLGFHILLLPTFVVEMVPVLDALPTWTACVLAVIAMSKREQNITAPPPARPGDKPTIEI